MLPSLLNSWGYSPSFWNTTLFFGVTPPFFGGPHLVLPPQGPRQLQEGLGGLGGHWDPPAWPQFELSPIQRHLWDLRQGFGIPWDPRGEILEGTGAGMGFETGWGSVWDESWDESWNRAHGGMGWDP